MKHEIAAEDELSAPGLPPGPDIPAWRVAQAWIDRPVEFWEECAARFGDVFTIELGSIGTTVLFARPDDVREIFALDPDSYVCRPYNAYSGTVMGDQAIFRTDGAEHTRKRRLVIPQLTRRPPAERWEALRGLVDVLVDSWPEGRGFAPRPSLHMLSLRFMLDIVFGGRGGEVEQRIVQIFSGEVYTNLGSWSAWAQFVRRQPELREAISARLAARRESGDPSKATLFDALALARDDSGAPLDDSEIQDHVFTTLIVGVDPVAIALAWALYWIHADADVLSQLRRELDAQGAALDPKRLLGLPYLTAVVQETLRMYPIPATPAGRKLVKPATIGGRRFEPGVTLLPCTYLVHRRAELYPSPDRFRPERFLERRYAGHEYFPFGGGARTCVGAGLAPQEIRLMLAAILLSCELEPAGVVVRPVRHGTLLAPSDDLTFTVRKKLRIGMTGDSTRGRGI